MKTEWWFALLGGGMIGLSATFLMLALGRVAGISGILGSLLDPTVSDKVWRAGFLLGLVVAGAVMFALTPASFQGAPQIGLPGVVLAGLLVGFGTRLGAGCTSGHGVCGVSRLSIRSLAATVTFIAAGALTVAMVSALGVRP